MIMEMRVYRCLPGRLPALMKRFDTLTLKLWDKHGIKQAGFYTTLIGTSNQELTYFVAWDSLADREEKWTTGPPSQYYGDSGFRSPGVLRYAGAAPMTWPVLDLSWLPIEWPRRARC